MPVGIPKLVFQPTEDDDPRWVDLYNRLYRDRFLFLGTTITARASNTLCGLLVFLSLEDPDQDQNLYINSLGGLIMPGLAIVDAVIGVKAPVRTYCIGLCASMASMILSAGEGSKRLAFPNARVMIHSPYMGMIDDELGDVTWEAHLFIEIAEILMTIYLKLTGRPRWLLLDEMGRDHFMSPDEATVFGLIDGIYNRNRRLLDGIYSGKSTPRKIRKITDAPKKE
uniref:ATP-dependent Clp protease proteolytic subunit n=1 Tax=Hypseocharis bilobata TaxID=253189 RepID=V9P7Y4_9ROSI|nr:clp protease proteolytic subunit [Hypseocharis bilobata]AGV02932.1 clp protease proteolytic subunit [Hypseocharis bilobata]